MMSRSEHFGRFRKLCLMSLLFAAFVTQETYSQSSPVVPDCIDGPSTWYNGTHNHTESGISCQRWDRNEPHEPRHTPSDGGQHNHCRNPDGDLKGTWCYTTNASVRWEYCSIPKCPDDSMVIWTNYDSKSESSHILSVYADPEIVKKSTDVSGIFNVSVLVLSNKTLTEFWALTGDYHRQIVFFTDYRLEYIGVRHLEHNITLKLYEGMAHGIENMAYDWVTRNLYWTDSEFKWVMASENTFRYYAPVYRTNGDSPYALTLHAKLRKLFFSTYKALQSKIITTDMSGNNERILFQFPEVYDVTGLTIDYTDDRLYWTDFTGYGGMVVSCRMDGSNKTQHHYRGSSIFWGVAAYLDYLYVTDVHARYSQNADKYYSVWVITKATNTVFRYTLNGKPRGITVLSKNEERSLDEVSQLGECSNSPVCDHICLPRINATRECACSLGYHKQGDTGCVSQLIHDEFLIMADSGQGRIFQISFSYNQSNPSSYSIVTAPSQTAKVTTVATDVVSGYVYWSDKRFESIKRSLLDGSRKSILATSHHANSMLVDPRSGNVYFVDSNTQYIYIISTDGSFMKPIMMPNAANAANTSIQMIAQDSVNRKIYWTDTRNRKGQGQVWRMDLDGMNKELVFDNLDWPRPITVDHKRRSLFIGEARTAMIYEAPLSSLTTITNTSPSSIRAQHDLSGHLARLSHYILDIKVYNHILYFVDGKTNRVEKFNLITGPASLSSFGPSEFYSVTSLSVQSRSYHQQYIANITSPCLTRNVRCVHICVDKSDLNTECLCSEGYARSGSDCLRESISRPNSPPSYGNSCPNDTIYQIDECADYVLPDWSEPTWTDDNTATPDLHITRPVIPPKLTAGPYVFTYTARDADGNYGICRFAIRVTETDCGEPPSTPSSMIASTKLCANKLGSMYNLQCTNSDLKISHGGSGFITSNVTNMCQLTGWTITDFKHLACKPSPITTASSSTARPTPTAPTSTTSTPTRTTTTSTTRRTTTTPRSTTTSTRSTTTSTEPTTSPTSLTVKSSTTKNDMNGVTNPIVGAQESTGLKPGPLAAICVLVILLVIIVVAVVIVTMRNRPIWKITRFEFPVFWKRKSDDAVEMNPSSDAPYSMMT